MKKTLTFLVALAAMTVTVLLLPAIGVFVFLSALVELIATSGQSDDSNKDPKESQGAWALRPMYHRDELIGYRVGWTVPMSNGKLLWVSTHEVNDEVDIEECRLRAIADLIHVTDSKHTPATYQVTALDQYM